MSSGRRAARTWLGRSLGAAEPPEEDMRGALFMSANEEGFREAAIEV